MYIVMLVYIYNELYIYMYIFHVQNLAIIANALLGS